MRNADALGEGPAAVDGFVEADVQAVDRVLVLGVRVDVDVVPGALPQVGVAVDAGEALAAVVGAVETARVAFHFHQDPDAVRVGG